MAAIRVHHTDVVDKSLDKGEAEKRLPNKREVLHEFYAWVDPDKDPDTKSAYRFGHHFVSSDGKVGAAAYRTTVVGIAELNGARAGTTIPDADRQGVWDHLAAHIRDFGKEPPELKSLFDASSDIERRSFPVVELRAQTTDAGPRILGYAAPFGVLSENLGGFREMVKAGAFTNTLKANDVRALWQHDPLYVLGRLNNNTLALKEDERGLWFEATPPDTQWARDALVSIQRGDVSQMSFAFNAVNEEWTATSEGLVRTLIEVQLFDVSPVTFPAYPQTSAQVRSRVFELSQQGGAGQASTPLAEVEAEARARRKRMQRLLDLAEKEI